MTKKTIIAVDSIFEAFRDSSYISSDNVLYIKTNDLKEWSKDQSKFTIKEFGDRINNIFVNFIYKDGDKDFKPDNLILEIKKALFLNKLSK